MPKGLVTVMAFTFPDIAKAYFSGLVKDDPLVSEPEKIAGRVEHFRSTLDSLDGQEEGNKIIVNEGLLSKWLGSRLQIEIIENEQLEIDIETAKRMLLIKKKFVPVVNNGMIVSIIDKDELCGNIASGLLKLR